VREEGKENAEGEIIKDVRLKGSSGIGGGKFQPDEF